MSITGIKQENYSNEDYLANNHLFSAELSRALEKEISEKIKKAFEFMKENNCDFMRLYDSFSKADYKGFNQFLNSIENKEDYFDYVELRVNLKIMPYQE